MPDGPYSVSDIQDYIECIIEKYKTLTAIPPILVYINRTNHRYVFKTKDWYKLVINVWNSISKSLDKTKDGEKVTSFEVAEVVLVQGDLLDNQYQQKSEL